MLQFVKLSTNNTWHEQSSVCIGEESLWVIFNLLDLEANTSIDAVGKDPSSEWS